MIRLIRKVFGVNFDLKFFVENVASMDREAAEQVSAALGVLPYRVQCSDVVPMSRPRFCWTNETLKLLPGLKIVKKAYYWEVTLLAEYPDLSQWICEDSEWPGAKFGTILPTCMKSIKRHRPPPRPNEHLKIAEPGGQRIVFASRLTNIRRSIYFGPIANGDCVIRAKGSYF